MNGRRRKGLGLTVHMLLWVLVVGGIAFWALDRIQQQAVDNLFSHQTRMRLQRQAMVDRLQFDSLLRAIGSSVRIFGAQEGLIRYLTATYPDNWLPRQEPRQWKDEAAWLPTATVRHAFPPIRLALLSDRSSTVREIYNPEGLALPADLAALSPLLLARSIGQILLARVGGAPYLLASAQAGEPATGYLTLAVPLDSHFFHYFSFVSTEETIKILVAGPQEQVLSSTDSRITPGQTMAELIGHYFVAGKKYFDYGGSELELSFVSLVPTNKVRAMSRIVSRRVRLQRVVFAVVLVGTFLFLILLLIGRIEALDVFVQEQRRTLPGIDEVELDRPEEADVLARLRRSFAALLAKVRSYQQQLTAKNRQLAHERDLTRRYLDMASVVVVVLDREGRVMEINRRGCELLGLAKNAILGRFWWRDFPVAEEAAGLQERFAAAMAGSQELPAAVDYTLVNAERERRRIHCRGVVLADEQGMPDGVLCCAEDVTLQRAAAEEREEMIRELSAALSQVKTLSGLLPICSWCKRIRNDSGYWDKLEDYLRHHSDAQFSHSVCPDCMRKHYPEYADEVLADMTKG